MINSPTRSDSKCGVQRKAGGRSHWRESTGKLLVVPQMSIQKHTHMRATLVEMRNTSKMWLNKSALEK